MHDAEVIKLLVMPSEIATLDCTFINLSSRAADLGGPLDTSAFIEQVVNTLRWPLCLQSSLYPPL
jgi:hypothetical protein